MSIIFSPPSAPPHDVVIHECRAVIDQYVHMSPERVAKADSAKPGSDASVSQNAFANARSRAITQAATGLGAQAGLDWRYDQISKLIKDKDIQSILDATFSFGNMITNQNVIYPVISEARQSVELSDDGQTARSSKVSWRIISPARIVTAPPNWRAYLYQTTGTPLAAPEGLMPNDAAEMATWETDVCAGFSQGARQADLIFQDRMARLVRDYTGMMRYKALLAQHVVSAPSVVEGSMGVRIAAGGDQVYVDDRIIRIKENSSFVGVNHWKPVNGLALPSDDGAKQ